MLKSEAGERSSDDDDEEDEDIDNEYSKSALLMQGKDGKKKKKGGSNSGSKPTSRSSTPVQNQQQDPATSDTLNQAAKSLKDAGSKRGHDSNVTSSPSSSSKKQKFNSSTGVASSAIRSNSPLTVTSGTERSGSPAVRSGTPSTEGQQQQGITESAIRRYLSHKPMTTTDLMRKFKTKKTGLSKEQTLSAIAAILKKIKPDQEKIDGKLHLSIKPKSWFGSIFFFHLKVTNIRCDVASPEYITFFFFEVLSCPWREIAFVNQTQHFYFGMWFLSTAYQFL